MSAEFRWHQERQGVRSFLRPRNTNGRRPAALPQSFPQHARDSRANPTKPCERCLLPSRTDPQVRAGLAYRAVLIADCAAQFQRDPILLSRFLSQTRTSPYLLLEKEGERQLRAMQPLMLPI